MTSPRKFCLITGCSEGGVGAALALVFERAGYEVFATARSPSKIPQAVHAAKNVTVFPLDVGSSESIAAAVEIVQGHTGGTLDVLLNNAGIGCNMPGLDTSLANARNLFDVNFFGAFEMIKMFAPMLVKAKGCIVNNSSVGGYCPLPFLSIYQASKAALTHAGEVWRLELAPLNVRVITLVSGGIQTEFVKNQPTLPLPETSYYRGIKDIIDEQPDKIPFGMEPSAFASDVVSQVEKGTTGKYWIGGGANLVRSAMWALPQSAFDQLGLRQKPFAKKLAEEHKKTHLHE